MKVKIVKNSFKQSMFNLFNSKLPFLKKIIWVKKDINYFDALIFGAFLLVVRK